jgi:hypothetical protein
VFKFIVLAFLLLITSLPCTIAEPLILTSTINSETSTSIPAFHYVKSFSVVLSEVKREGDIATLYFAITKVANTSSSGVNLKVTLTDDHGNKYSGILYVNLEGAPSEVIPLLPLGFTYVDSINISIPDQAPIETIRFGDGDEISFKDVKFVEPKFRRDFGPATIRPGTNVSLGKYLTFTIKGPEGGIIGWTLPVTVTNTEYNPISVDVKVGVQFLDGRVTWSKAGSVTVNVPASGKVMLEPQIITISQGVSQGYPRMILAYCADKSTGEQVLKLMPIDAGQLPPIPERIAFDSSSGYYMNVIRSDGSGDIFHMRWLAEMPSWSPEGDKIAFDDGWNRIYIAFADGINETYICVGGYPSWSPDGKKLAYVSDIYQTSLSIINIDGSDQIKIAETGTLLLAIHHPSWSPDGTKIVFSIYSSDPVYGQKWKIYIVTSDGTGKPQLVGEGDNPAWSADGKKIAFEYKGYIYVMNADGTEKTKLAPGVGPAWLPDGTIIYSCGGIIYTMNADGFGQTKLIEDGEYPVWAPAFQLEKQPIEWDARNSSEISCSIYSPLIGYGETIGVTGSISPARSGVPAILIYTKPDGTTISRYVETMDKGEYADVYQPDKVGIWAVMALWAGDEDYCGAASSTISFTVSKEIIIFTLSPGWGTKELFVPIYHRSLKEPGNVELGAYNKRDMWYLVKVYKRQAGQSWQEMVPWELSYIAPWSEKTFSYTPKDGEEIKIEVWNDLNDKTLTALWTLDFATRALLGVSISSQVTNPEVFTIELLTFYNDFLNIGGYLGAGQWKQAVLQLGKTLATNTKAQEALVSLLKLVGVEVATKIIVSEALLIPAHYIVNVPVWWDFWKNTNKEPFMEEVIFTAKRISPPVTLDIKVTKSLAIVQDGPYYVGETINAQFTINNKGSTSINFSTLTVGGRGPKGDADIRDFTFRTNITLNSGESYNYQGGLKLLDNGSYHFFIAYQAMDGKWITSVPTEAGTVNTLNITVNPIPERWIGAELCSPGELRIYDSQGRVTGLVNGKERNEIPHSAYYGNIVVILSSSDSYKYQVVGLSAGSYNLTTTNVIGGKSTTFTATGISTSSKAIHQYTIDWDALSRGEKGTTIQIDSNGDGTFERSIASGKEATSAEFTPPTQELPLWIWIIVGVAAVSMVGIIGVLKWRRRASA